MEYSLLFKKKNKLQLKVNGNAEQKYLNALTLSRRSLENYKVSLRKFQNFYKIEFSNTYILKQVALYSYIETNSY